jgi:hypothetical protein
MRSPCLEALAGIAMIAALLAAAPRAMATADADSAIQTGADLMDVCSDASDSSKIACKFYVLGVLQSAAIMRAADTGQTDTPLYCASDATTTGDLIVAIRGLVSAHPDRLQYPAASVVVGGAMEAYPCKHTPRPKPRRHAHHKTKHS